MKEKILAFLKHPGFLGTLKVIVGFLFIIASIGKIIDPGKFMTKVYEYSILPDSLVPLFAHTLPWVEFLVGTLLITDNYVQAAALIACGTLIAFISAIYIQISRGVTMECGCFDFLFADKKTGWHAVFQDLFIFIFAGILFIFDKNELSMYGLFRKK